MSAEQIEKDRNLFRELNLVFEERNDGHCFLFRYQDREPCDYYPSSGKWKVKGKIMHGGARSFAKFYAALPRKNLQRRIVQLAYGESEESGFLFALDEQGFAWGMSSPWRHDPKKCVPEEERPGWYPLPSIPLTREEQEILNDG